MSLWSQSKKPIRKQENGTKELLQNMPEVGVSPIAKESLTPYVL